MLRLVALLSFATIALGQMLEEPAYVRIETTTAGELHASLLVPNEQPPAGLPAAFAQAVGCGTAGLEKSGYESSISVRCALSRPSPLTFHATFRLAELTPMLREAGADGLDLVLTTARFRWLRLDPVITPEGSRSDGYYNELYSLDKTPQQITIDGRFELGQALTLIACALGLILAPFLLRLPRPSDPLRLHVRTQSIFVLGAICWIWVLLRFDANALLSYLFGRWTVGPLLALIAPPLMAVWIGSRLAAVEYARLTPNGLGVDYYHRIKFWMGAAAVCVLSMALGAPLATPTNALGSMLLGFVLAIACLTRLKRAVGGRSHPLAEGDLRKRMFELAAKAGADLRRVSILTLATPRSPFAFATRRGTIFLSEGLLRRLSRREVDAIVCHELSHLRPLKRSLLVMVYALVVTSVLGTSWMPNFVDFVPALLLAAYFLFKAWRRAGERTRIWTRYAGAMIPRR